MQTSHVEGFLDLLRDNSSVLGRLVTTGVLLAVAVPVGALSGRAASRRSSDPYARYYLLKSTRYAFLFVVLIVHAVLWQPFAGQIGVVLGLAAAGVAFAMQEVIGALAGWASILSSRQFRVGDRVQMGGVRGDVLDITPLCTKVLEIGSADDNGSWVRARQYTGRLVSISNKAVLASPCTTAVLPSTTSGKS